MRRWLLLIPLAAAIMVPSLMLGPGWTHSEIYNFIWTRQLGEAMAAGHLYPRWLPASFDGLGSPTFYFYPPLAFWISGAFDAAGLTTLQAINVTGVVLLLASGLTMYAWLSYRGARPLLGASLYMLAPYHLLDFYQRGALAEFAAFVWLPLIALGIEMLPRRRGGVLLAVALAGLMLSHLPMTVLVGAFLIAPLVLYRAWSDHSVVIPALVAGALGTGLAAFYLLPAMTLQPYICDGLLWGHLYQPQTWFIWNAQGRYLLRLPPIGIAMAVLATPSRSIWTVITVAAALAVLGLIPFIWDIPLLAKAQFPWRLLCISEFAGVTALAVRPPRPVLAGIVGVLLIIPYVISSGYVRAGLLHPVDYGAIVRWMPDAPEYLPRGLDVSAISDRQRYIDMTPYQNLPRGSEFVVRRAGRVTIHQAAFPIWKIMRDGQEIPSHGPLVTFDAAPGVYRLVRVTLWQEWAGGIISVLAAALLAAAALSNRVRKPARSTCRRGATGPVAARPHPQTEVKPS